MGTDLTSLRSSGSSSLGGAELDFAYPRFADPATTRELSSLRVSGGSVVGSSISISNGSSVGGGGGGSGGEMNFKDSLEMSPMESGYAGRRSSSAFSSSVGDLNHNKSPLGGGVGAEQYRQKSGGGGGVSGSGGGVCGGGGEYGVGDKSGVSQMPDDFTTGKNGPKAFGFLSHSTSADLYGTSFNMQHPLKMHSALSADFNTERPKTLSDYERQKTSLSDYDYVTPKMTSQSERLSKPPLAALSLHCARSPSIGHSISNSLATEAGGFKPERRHNTNLADSDSDVEKTRRTFTPVMTSTPVKKSDVANSNTNDKNNNSSKDDNDDDNDDDDDDGKDEDSKSGIKEADTFKDPNVKPPYSYVALIAMAIKVTIASHFVLFLFFLGYFFFFILNAL
jgi:hypothetical protein